MFVLSVVRFHSTYGNPGSLLVRFFLHYLLLSIAFFWALVVFLSNFLPLNIFVACLFYYALNFRIIMNHIV